MKLLAADPLKNYRPAEDVPLVQRPRLLQLSPMRKSSQDTRARPILITHNSVEGTTALGPPTSYIVFTAYSMTSTYSSGGNCITASGLPIGLQTPISVIRPATADASRSQSTAISQILSFLGSSTCANGVSAVVNLPNETASTLAIIDSNTLTSATPLTSLTSPILTSTAFPAPTSTPLLPTTSSAPKSIPLELSERNKIVIGTVLPAVAIVSVLLCTAYLRRRWKRRHSDKEKNDSADSSENIQPYLQQKSELDCEERRQLELDAQERRFEMDGVDTRCENEGVSSSHEVPVEGRRQGLLSLEMLHELKGEEHSKELGGPDIL